MSESFQEFCKRILPAVQAGAEGKKIDFFSNAQNAWVSDEGYGFWLNTKCRITEPKATPLPITPEMWAMIDPKYQWAVFTKLSHGYEAVGFSSKPPKFNGDKWDFSDIDYVCTSPLNIDTNGIIPEMSLTKRPEPVKVKNYPEPPEFTVNVDRLQTAAEMLKELDGIKTTANTPTDEGVRPRNFCASCGSEVNLGMQMRNIYQESLMSIPEKVEEESDLDKLKSQATHYMSKIGGKIYFRRFEGDWQLLHEPSKLWLSVYLVDESKLIEIK